MSQRFDCMRLSLHRIKRLGLVSFAVSLFSCAQTVYYQPPANFAQLATIHGVQHKASEVENEVVYPATIDGLPLSVELGDQGYLVGSGSHWLSAKYDGFFKDTLWGLLSTNLKGQVLMLVNFNGGRKYELRFERLGKIVQIWVIDRETGTATTEKFATEIKEPETDSFSPTYIYVPTK